MTDHRVIVGAERREKTRARLLKGALHVFSLYGSEAKVIDLVIKNAGVSRGTFYNYFRTNEELFIEVAKEVSNEIIRAVDPIVSQQRDPAARIACGVVSVVRLARRFPVLAQFIVKGGPIAMTTGNLTTTVVPRDIQSGIAAGQFSITDEELAFDLVLGPIIMAFHRIVKGEVAEGYPNELAQSVLQSLGVQGERAKEYASIAFVDVELAEPSLLRQ